MAIRDLLWACPLCGTIDAILPTERGERCRSCRTEFRRRERSMIEAMPPGRPALRRPAPEWSAGLGEPRLEAIRSRLPSAGDPERLLRASARVRIATERKALRAHGGRFLGLIEVFDSPSDGTLTLTETYLEFAPTDGVAHRWRLASVRAITGSSGSLQIRAHDGALLSIRLPESSLRLWDEVLHDAVRAAYSAMGKGPIIEFQPRIVALSAPQRP